MNRRQVAYTLALGALAGCTTQASGGGSGTTTVVVSLANVQAEAAAIINALDADAPALIATLPQAMQDKAMTALKAANTAVSALIGLPSTSTTFAMYLQAAIQAIAGVLALVPFPVQVQMGIQAGLILLSALANNLSNVTVTTPPAPVAGPPRKLMMRGAPVTAPIPIPVS